MAVDRRPETWIYCPIVGMDLPSSAKIGFPSYDRRSRQQTPKEREKQDCKQSSPREGPQEQDNRDGQDDRAVQPPQPLAGTGMWAASSYLVSEYFCQAVLWQL